VDHRDVAVHAQHGQAEDGRKHVDAVDAEHQPTHQRPEGPMTDGGRRGQKGNAQHEQLVGNRQVEDVNVRGRFHFGVLQNDVDDHGIAGQPDTADDGVDGRDDDATGVGLLVVVLIVHACVVGQWSRV